MLRLARLFSAAAPAIAKPTQLAKCFADLQLERTTQLALDKEFKYTDMSHVQQLVLTDQSQQDMLVRAKTGTGKTLAFLVAALQQAKFEPRKIPILVISPTRELAAQIAREATRLCAFNKRRVCLAVGGTSRSVLVNQLTRGQTDILVATPGRLVDILSSVPEVLQRLSGLQVLVIDECDQLLDMGFKQEMHEITSRVGTLRKTLLFSATLGDNIQQAAKSMLKPGHVHIDTVPENETDTHLLIKQSSIVASYKQHTQLINQIVSKHQETEVFPKIVVFFQTTKMVVLMSEVFAHLGVPVMQLHSKLDQTRRTRISDRFRKARSGILFTSDVSARGVDYPDVTLVLSVGMPQSRDQYIHRIGRTGRAGKKGEAILLLNPFEKRFLESLGDLPIRPDLRFNPHAEQQDAEKSAKAVAAMEETDIEDRISLVMASFGFQIGKMDASKLDKTSIVMQMKDLSVGMLGLPDLPRMSGRMITTLGLDGVCGLGNTRQQRPEARGFNNRNVGQSSSSSYGNRDQREQGGMRSQSQGYRERNSQGGPPAWNNSKENAGYPARGSFRDSPGSGRPTRRSESSYSSGSGMERERQPRPQGQGGQRRNSWN